MQNATLSNIVATNSGTGVDNGVVFDFWTTYAGTSFSNIAFNNVTITNDAAHPLTLAGIRVAAFEDAASAPTNLSFTDVSISGDPTAPDPIGIRTSADEAELHFLSTGTHPNGVALTDVDTALRFEGRAGDDNFDASALPGFGSYILMGDRFNHIDPIANPTGGNDILKGGASSDQLFGDAGNDTLNGGAAPTPSPAARAMTPSTTPSAMASTRSTAAPTPTRWRCPARAATTASRSSSTARALSPRSKA